MQLFLTATSIFALTNKEVIDTISSRMFNPKEHNLRTLVHKHVINGDDAPPGLVGLVLRFYMDHEGIHLQFRPLEREVTEEEVSYMMQLFESCTEKINESLRKSEGDQEC